MILAQQFTAGKKSRKNSKSAKRTAESECLNLCSSADRFADFALTPLSAPSDESLGYFRSSANTDSEMLLLLCKSIFAFIPELPRAYVDRLAIVF
jgi:hypothetical protein